MINHKFSLENTFQVLHMIDNWINEGSGWIVELIESQYINISTYRPLSRRFYVKLPAEIRRSKKWQINIKNNAQKCFLRRINPVKIHPERITREDKKLVNDLDYDRVEFSVREKILARLKRRTIFRLTYFVTKIGWHFQFTFQFKNLKSRWICCL